MQFFFMSATGSDSPQNNYINIDNFSFLSITYMTEQPTLLVVGYL